MPPPSEAGHPVEGCTAAPYALRNGKTTNVYPGADFRYLSANVVVDATGRTLFPAFATKTFETGQGRELRVGFIGEVLEATPTIVTGSVVAFRASSNFRFGLKGAASPT